MSGSDPAALDRQNQRVVAIIGLLGALFGALIGATASLLGSYLAGEAAADASRTAALREQRATAYREFLQAMDAFTETAGVTRSCAGIGATERATIARCSTLDGTIAAGLLRLRVAGDAVVVAGPDSARTLVSEFTGKAITSAEPMRKAQIQFEELKALHQQVTSATPQGKAAAQKDYDRKIKQVLALLGSPEATSLTERAYEDYRQRFQEIMKKEASA